MTAKPTLTLDASEWRSLLAANFHRAADFVQGNQVVDMDGLKALHQHLDRMKALASAWHYSALPPVEKSEAKPNGPDVAVVDNGVVLVAKKKRGRPRKVVEAAAQ
jgi:hypothetical protein